MKPLYHSRWKFLFFILILRFYMKTWARARNIERYDTAYECEGKTLKIECKDSELIHLIRANYGRFSITICNEHGNTDWSVNCMSPKSFRVLYNKCNQQQNCSIMASTLQFGDPCPNTLKYLEAHYQCISATTSSISRLNPSWLITSQSPVWNNEKLTTKHNDYSSSKFVPPDYVNDTMIKRNSSYEFSNVSLAILNGNNVQSESTQKESKVGNMFPVKGNDEKHQTDIKMILPLETNTLATTTSSHYIPSFSPQLSSQTESSSTFSVRFENSNYQTKPDSNNEIMYDKKFSSILSTSLSCPAQTARNLIWNATRFGEIVVQTCPGGTIGMARWMCLRVSTHNKIDIEAPVRWFGKTPDLSDCRSVWLSTLERRVQEGEVILSISNDLSQVTNNSHELYGGDMFITSKILKNMAERMSFDIKTYQDPRQREVNVAELLQGVITTGSNLLDKAQSASWKDLNYHKQMLAVTLLLQGLEENAFLLANAYTIKKNIIYERPNILMEVRVLELRNLDNETEIFPWKINHQIKWTKFHNRIELTKGALLSYNKDGLVRLVFMAFDGLEEILQPQLDNFPYNVIENSKSRLFLSTITSEFSRFNRTRIINSKVISASLGKGKHMQLAEPVKLYFRHLIFKNVTNPRCVFWDLTTREWSEDGCITRKSNVTHTVCECNHLTNFAVLADVPTNEINDIQIDQKVAEMIIYIGCLISAICLVLAIITFQLFLKSDRTTIQKNLCICLLVAEVLFANGISQTHQKIVCTIIAGLLHFFFLCTFTWMLLEGFQLYIMLIEIFEAEKSHIRWYYFAAYGTPLFIVLFSCMIDLRSYGTDRYCWLHANNYFMLSLVGPVIIIILADIVFLSMAIFLMYRHANTILSLKNKECSHLSNTRSWLRGAIILVFLLVLTWTFGVLNLNKESAVIAYIFSTLNSSQGLFIFIFNCVLNKKVQKEYRKLIRQSSWLPKCLVCSKIIDTNGLSISTTDNCKDFTQHSTSSNLSATRNLEMNEPQTNNISSKPPLRERNSSSQQDGSSHILNSNSSCTMTFQGYSLRPRERRLLAELEIGSRATTGRRTISPYNHTYTEIRDQQHLNRYYHHRQNQDDPVYEEIERSTEISRVETAQASDMSDEDGRRQSDMSRQSSRSYGDHRPLIPYSPGTELPWTLDKLRRQTCTQLQQSDLDEMQLRPQDHTRTIAVLDGHTVVCHLQPQLDMYASRGLPPSYSEC